jgi:hypothetical protein
MSTISSSINNTYMIYKMAEKNGMSLFGTNNSNKSASSGSSSSIWDSYYGSSTAAASTLNGLSGINSSRAELVSSYDDAAKTFKAEFGSAMKDLSGSISSMKKLDYNVGSDAITSKTTTAEDGTTTTSSVYNDKLKEALSTIEKFADNYNTATKLFKDYGDVSKKMAQMGSVFSDVTARADTYAQIGLNVGSDGKIKIDEEKLAKALTESPGRVEGILGKDGLTGKAEDHVRFAEGQSDRLFPSINSMFGDQLKMASVYTGGAMVKMSSFATAGNLLDMMF